MMLSMETVTITVVRTPISNMPYIPIKKLVYLQTSFISYILMYVQYLAVNIAYRSLKKDNSLVSASYSAISDAQTHTNH